MKKLIILITMLGGCEYPSPMGKGPAAWHTVPTPPGAPKNMVCWVWRSTDYIGDATYGGPTCFIKEKG